MTVARATASVFYCILTVWTDREKSRSSAAVLRMRYDVMTQQHKQKLTQQYRRKRTVQTKQ